MILQPDLILRDTLGSFFAVLHTDVALIDRIFPTRPATERAQIRAYFLANIPAVRLGYPRAASELPGVFIILGTLQETDRGQTIGGVLSEVETLTLFTEEQGAHFSGVVRLACWTTNADLTVWLQSLVFVALLQARTALNDAGLIEQKLNATDFEPLPQWFPDVAFRRDVALSMVLPLSAPEDFHKIDDVVVDATFATNPARTVVVRR